MEKLPRLPAFLAPIQRRVDPVLRNLRRGFVLDSEHIIAIPEADGSGRMRLKLRDHLLGRPASSGDTGDQVCAYYGDFWPAYYHDPTGYWKRYCRRTLDFDLARPSNVASNFSSEPPGFWFEPDGANVPELFSVFPDPIPDGDLHIHLELTMYRDVIPPDRTPVGGETDSIPFIDTICYTPL